MIVREHQYHLAIDTQHHSHNVPDMQHMMYDGTIHRDDHRLYTRMIRSSGESLPPSRVRHQRYVTAS
jgi:hypothetical protein